MERQVGIEKDNAMTRLAREVKQLNAERGNALGQSSGSPTVLMPGPMVKTAPMLSPAPLSAEEVAERDQRAVELGILSPEDVAEPITSLVGPLPERYRPTGPINTSPVPRPTLSRLPNFRNVEGYDLINNVVNVDGMSFPLSEEASKDFRRYAIELATDYVTKELASALAELYPLKTEAPAPVPETNEPDTQAETTTEVQRNSEGSSETTPK